MDGWSGTLPKEHIVNNRSGVINTLGVNFTMINLFYSRNWLTWLTQLELIELASLDCYRASLFLQQATVPRPNGAAVQFWFLDLIPLQYSV